MIIMIGKQGGVGSYERHRKGRKHLGAVGRLQMHDWTVTLEITHNAEMLSVLLYITCHLQMLRP